MSEAEDQQRSLGTGRPVFVLGEDTERTEGRDAQTANIAAGKAVEEAVRTTLGPNGMDKMLVSDDGNVVITNDGATILSEMDIDHPAAEMIVDVSDTQDEEVGDGTTTAAVLTGELLSKAEGLIDDDVHPTTIVEGYAAARDIAVETVEENVVGGRLDRETLERVAVSSMTGKSIGDATAEQLAGTIVDAVTRIQSGDHVDRDALKVIAAPGRSSNATELVEGTIIEHHPDRSDAPLGYENPTVAAVVEELDYPDTEVEYEYDVTSADQYAEALDAEEAYFQKYVDALVEHDVDVVFTDEEVEDDLNALFAAQGITTFGWLDDDEFDDVLAATGAEPISDLANLDPDDLGSAESLQRETIADEDYVRIAGGDDATNLTLFVRGGTGHVADELERSVADGVDAVVSAINGGGVVPGAGTVEIRAASAVREAAAGIEGRKQIAAEAFADAIETLPHTLAQNAGCDPIDILVELRAANEEGPAGILGLGAEGRVENPVEHGVFDPAQVKREAISSAVEAATMIVRIDDIITSD